MMNNCALVLGCGKSGLAAARLLYTEGYRVLITDDRWKTTTDIPGSHLFGEIPQVTPVPWLAWSNKTFDFVVISPGLDPRRKEIVDIKRSTVPVISEFELGLRRLSGSVVAITGTNGKTTVTEMVTAVLQQAGWTASAVGNIGEAMCDVARCATRADWWVCEISSFQLEHTHMLRPRVAAVLNISDDHLDRYDSMRDYALTKWSIFKNHGVGDTLVIGSSLKSSCPYPESIVVEESTESIRRTNENFTLAITAACGVAEHVARQALAGFPEPAHRREVFHKHNGVIYVNDSKSTNVHALEYALNEFLQPIILIAGGRDKNMDFARIAPLIKSKVKHLILLGETKHKLAQAWQETPYTLVEDLFQAAELAVRMARDGDVVLLSPACASLDQFRDYKERGNLFKEAICRITNKTTN